MGSPGTVELYIFAVRKFVQFLGAKDPEAALQDLASGKLNATVQVDKFIDYYLKAHAHKTVLGQLRGIKKWLDLNGVKVEWPKIDMPTSAAKQEEDRAPSKEELKTLLNHANGARDRAAILVLASSGLRIGTLLSLTIGDVSFDYPDVARMKVESRMGRKFMGKGNSSVGRFFSTFTTPEAKQVLQQYLKERENAGEKLTAKSPLIGDAYHKGRFTSVVDFEQVWQRILKRSGLADKSQKWYKLHLHTLRKFFRSNCVGVDESYRESWMGHKGKYLDESYFRAEEEKHLAEYRKAIPHLTVYTTVIEEKRMRSKMLVDFARLQGTPESEIRKLEEVLARSKTVDEGITEFRRLQEEPLAKPRTMHDGNGKYLVAKGEDEMIQRLHDGWRMVQALNHDKYLLEKA
ncbi:MAG: site-specific integrase [Candidatus Bathyarchaeia archaeon]